MPLVRLCGMPGSEHPLFDGNRSSWGIRPWRDTPCLRYDMWDAGIRASLVRREHTLMGEMGRRDTPCLRYDMWDAGLRASRVWREHTLLGEMGRQDTPCPWYDM